jgi:hypothetical protein
MLHMAFKLADRSSPTGRLRISAPISSCSEPPGAPLPGYDPYREPPWRERRMPKCGAKPPKSRV